VNVFGDLGTLPRVSFEELLVRDPMDPGRLRIEGRPGGRGAEAALRATLRPYGPAACGGVRYRVLRGVPASRRVEAIALILRAGEGSER
jgi:hypothetical protein